MPVSSFKFSYKMFRCFSLKSFRTDSESRRTETVIDIESPADSKVAENLKTENNNESKNSNEAENNEVKSNDNLNTVDDSITPKQTVTFSREKTVVLIPSRQVLHLFKQDLWYSKDELWYIKQVDEWELSLIRSYWRRVMSDISDMSNEPTIEAKHEEFRLR